jgi:hypothetical protein
VIRLAWLLAVIAACKMGPAPAKTASGSGSGSGSAQPPAPEALVELLHSVPATIRLSSTVANKSILPVHIADHDLGTAWNSRTGDLRGAWVDLAVPGAGIREVRLTVGHTGTGPKGEDYFTMNPRIRKVTLIDGDHELAHAELDTTRRALQVVKLPEPHAHVRVRIDDVVMGTKRSWRETCISEIEAWGTLPAGVTAHAMQPVVEVEPPRATSWDTPPLDAATYCTRFLEDPTRDYKKTLAELDASCSACMKAKGNDMECMQEGSCNPDPPGPPSCSLDVTAKVSAGAWLGAGTVATSTDSEWGTTSTQIIVATREGAWPIGDVYECGRHENRCEVTVTAAKVAADGTLEVSATVKQDGTTTKLAYACTPSPVSCEEK